MLSGNPSILVLGTRMSDAYVTYRIPCRGVLTGARVGPKGLSMHRFAGVVKGLLVVICLHIHTHLHRVDRYLDRYMYTRVYTYIHTHIVKRGSHDLK